MIFGDVLRYNRELGRAEGEGGVRMQSGVDRFFGPRMEYNTLDGTGVFEQPTFLLQREQEARGGAERVEFLGRDKFRFLGAHYTTCRPGQEDWVLTAKELELDFESEEGRATSPRLRFFDVPILGASSATFPLNNRRRSGLLAPYYSQSSTRGFELGVPFYWNIAPEYDATITPVTMSRRGTQLKNQFRYLKFSLAFILGFVGVKMILVAWHVKVPAEISLGVIVSALAVGIVTSLRASRREKRAAAAPEPQTREAQDPAA